MGKSRIARLELAAFALLTLSALMISGCQGEEVSLPIASEEPRVVSALPQGDSGVAPPESFPFYRMKSGDAFWYQNESGAFDSSGIIMRDYEDQGIHYHPVLLATYALRLYDSYYVSRAEDARGRFLLYADWLVDNLKPWGDGWAWVYDVPNPSFGARGQWISGMAQGLGIAVLAQAWAITGEHQYLNAADQAMDVFELNLSAGGVLTLLPDGGWWYEEVASPDTESSLILNGCIFAVIGLGYYADIVNDTRARHLYEAGVQGIRELLPDFDGYYSSLYCLLPAGELRPTGDYYNIVHVQQLLELWRREASIVFAEYALRFLEYQADAQLDPEITVRVSKGDEVQQGAPDDITDILSDVQGYWEYSAAQDATLSFRDISGLPVVGVALREWQGNHLGDFDVSLRDENGEEYLVGSVRTDTGSSTHASVLKLKVRNRDAEVWFFALNEPCVSGSGELRLRSASAGLRQLRLVHDYPYVVAPTDSRLVLQEAVLYMFDGNDDTGWNIPDDSVALLLRSGTSAEHVILTWSTGSGELYKESLDLTTEDVSCLSATDGGSEWFIEFERLGGDIFRAEVRAGYSSGVRLHEFSSESGDS